MAGINIKSPIKTINQIALEEIANFGVKFGSVLYANFTNIQKYNQLCTANSKSSLTNIKFLTVVPAL